MRVLLILSLVLLVPGGSSAQRRVPSFLETEPATARLSTRHLEAVADGDVRVTPDGRAIVRVLVTPGPKMHVYGPDVTGYVPFSLLVEPSRGVVAGKVTYPPSETYVFPPTGESSRAYMKPFVVSQAITVDAATRRLLAAGTPVTLRVSLRYQACDDRVCYRPTSGALGVTLTR